MAHSFPTQAQLVKGYMERHRAITPLDAINELGITRLSARIWELEHIQGIKVYRRHKLVHNRFGATTYVAVPFSSQTVISSPTAIRRARAMWKASLPVIVI